MNIEQVKQFIKEVRWGFLATTDGRRVSKWVAHRAAGKAIGRRARKLFK
jgi:hypothetical protein